MFENELLAELAKDGLLYRFDAEDVKQLLDSQYPKDKTGWFFNSTRDRYCAEWSRQGEDKIIMNPSIVFQMFGMPILRED